MSLVFNTVSTIHQYICCDGCHMEPIQGKRWRCNQCLGPNSFDLCDGCHAKQIHSHHELSLVQGEDVVAAHPIPLVESNLVGSVYGRTAKLLLSQTYENKENINIEAIYKFPLHPKIALVGMRMITDDRRIDAEIMAKKEGQIKYDDALAGGHGACIVEQSAEDDDMYTMSIGNMEKGQKCIIEIDLIHELEHVEGDRYRFCFPTALAPRYGLQDVDTWMVSDQTSGNLDESSYKMSIDVTGQTLKQIVGITSVSHPTITVDCDANHWFVKGQILRGKDLIVDFTLESGLPDNKFFLERTRDTNENSVFSAAIQVEDLISGIDLGSALSGPVASEIILVIDCSGSMKCEDRIKHAKTAADLLVKALPTSVKFNIVRFGSTYQFLFTESVPYNENNLDVAVRYLKGMKANMDGTEMLEMIQEIVKIPVDAEDKTWARAVILLTDGEASNSNDIIQVAESVAPTTRFFTIGIGSSPGRALLDGVAKRTNGKSEYVTDSQDIATVTMRQLKRALEPCFRNVELGFTDIQTSDYLLKPKPIAAYYPGDKVVVYGMFTDHWNYAGQAKISYLDGKVLRSRYLDPIYLGFLKDTGIGHLAAKGTIEQMKQNHADEESLTRSAVALGVLTEYTCFVGVEKRTNACSNGMETRRVPIQIRQGHGGFGTNKVHPWALKAFMTNPTTLCSMSCSPNTFGCDSRDELEMDGTDDTLICKSANLYENFVPKFESNDDDMDILQKPAVDYLTLILSMQNWEGYWTSDSVSGSVLDEIQVHSNMFEKEREKLDPPMGVSPGIITGLVLVHLHMAFQDRKELWEMAFKKAMNYMKLNYPTVTKIVEEKCK